MKKSIIVIGGGIVGVAAALQLQLDGHQVRLIDRQQPGRETSYGNAGVLSDSSVVVLNNPGLIKALPKLLLNLSNGLRYNSFFVLRRLGWFVRFLAHCRPSHVKHAAHALRALLQLSLGQHKKWIKTAGVDHLLRHGGGWLKLFRTEKALPIMRLRWISCGKLGSRFRSLIANRSGKSNLGLHQSITRAC